MERFERYIVLADKGRIRWHATTLPEATEQHGIAYQVHLLVADGSACAPHLPPPPPPPSPPLPVFPELPSDSKVSGGLCLTGLLFSGLGFGQAMLPQQPKGIALDRTSPQNGIGRKTLVI